MQKKDRITLEKVLLLKDKDSVTIGKPYIKNAKIELEVVSHRIKKFLYIKCAPRKKQEEKWVIDRN